MENFGEYEKVGDPDKREKSEYWRVAIGLQATDGLQVSDYLKKLAIRNIEGEITTDEVEQELQSYYQIKDNKERIKEADFVATRIKKLLATKAFSFSVAEYIEIHRTLFDGLLTPAGEEFAGVLRDYTVAKKEWILNDDTVEYGFAPSIMPTLQYEFQMEKETKYDGLTLQQKVQRIIKFMASIWQIHAFKEGNTRTTAVFIIKYLRFRGYKADNKFFEQNAWYFRNALVRANYVNDFKGVSPSFEYLNKFFENMLFNGTHELSNRDLLINHS